MFYGRSASFASALGENISRQDASLHTATNSLTFPYFLPASPTHIVPADCVAVKTRPLERSRPRLAPSLPPSRSSSPRTPFPLPLAVPRKLGLVQFGFQKEARRPCNILSPVAATHRNFVSSCRRECAKNPSNPRQQQAQKCSQRPEAPKLTPSLSETAAQLVGEGGTVGARDRLRRSNCKAEWTGKLNARGEGGTTEL